MKEIIFTNINGFEVYPPKPAVKDIPDWYINTEEYYTGKKEFLKDGSTPHTVKKCMPVFDAMTSGYIIYSQVDVQVTQDIDSPYYMWRSQNAISFHPVEQAPLHPNKNNFPYPKWTNPYSIKTSPGYSCLFTNIMHRENKIFTILPGIVDTDNYSSPVHFPFVLNDPKWEGVIPAGTPIAQVIPFKRDSWQMKIGSEKEMIEQRKTTEKLLTKFFNSYKHFFWSKKEYR
jgi:hypothetical protein